MKYLKFLSILLVFVFIFSKYTSIAFAITDPLSTSNNKFGVHILFPSELKLASKLVNSSGGDWGYVTIPIQSGDRDLVKWQNFLNDAYTYHLIPIIRISTEGDFFNTQVWRKPTFLDIQDFANFLNSLSWPTKNRYIVVFNEPNDGDEWGGSPNPTEYAQILSYAVTVFKSKSPNFFIISAGFDNAAITQGTTSMDEFEFMNDMNQAVPGIFNQIDGLGSHSYPNPAFSSPPTKLDGESIVSYRYEEQIVQNLSNKILPIFITETGWSREQLTGTQVSSYYTTAFNTVWTDSNIVAITPFILQGTSSPYEPFSLLDSNNKPTSVYNTIMNLPKVKGKPVLISPQVLGVQTYQKPLPIVNYSQNTKSRQYTFSVSDKIIQLGKWFLKLN